MKDGQWFMWPIDRGIPTTVKIYEGSVEHRKYVETINRHQAMALIRWHGHKGIYFGYRDGNGKMIDVRVAGDIDAWRGEGRGDAL